jgi:uncharacterized RmlC-like cupin family protein
MGLARMPSHRAIATHRVGTTINYLHVVRIHAGADSAKMVDLQSIGNGTIKGLERHPMS